jgi:hypothetical protein
MRADYFIGHRLVNLTRFSPLRNPQISSSVNPAAPLTPHQRGPMLPEPVTLFRTCGGFP